MQSPVEKELALLKTRVSTLEQQVRNIQSQLSGVCLQIKSHRTHHEA